MRALEGEVDTTLQGCTGCQPGTLEAEVTGFAGASAPNSFFPPAVDGRLLGILRFWFCLCPAGSASGYVWSTTIFFCSAGAVEGSRLAAPVAVVFGGKGADGLAEATRLVACVVVSGEAAEVAREGAAEVA